MGYTKAEDGRRLVLNFPATAKFRTWLTSRCDDLSPTPPATGRGEGAQFRLDFTAQEVIDEGGPLTKTGDFQFIEPVEIHDAQFVFTPADNWSCDDEVSVGVCMPATPATNVGSGGNADKVELFGSGVHMFVPAADGAWSVTLSDAVPVPAPDVNGYWDCDHFSGTVTTSTKPGAADFLLLDYDPGVRWFAKNLALAHPLGYIDVDPASAEWIHPNWLLHWECTKSGESDGTIMTWGFFYREHNA